MTEKHICIILYISVIFPGFLRPFLFGQLTRMYIRVVLPRARAQAAPQGAGETEAQRASMPR